jgi:putative peptidoglycan lipid II flippase
MAVVAIPSAVFAVLMAGPIAGTAFGGGRYTAEDVVMTGSALAMYAWGLPFMGVSKLMAGASYAWKQPREPVIAAAVNLAVFFVLGVVLTPRFGIAGIAAAASVGQMSNAATLVALNRRAGRLPAPRAVWPGLVRHGLAAAAMAGALLAIRGLLPPLLVTSVQSVALLAGVAAVAGAVYVGVLVLVGAEEWRELAGFLRARGRRPRASGPEAPR